ncbi:hypothetical protein Taro_025988 [Colocasia esculenta]|uniref:Secreted protein n=1 Tax=Colocasia esculenta TaxID=4460 RepID=A0A843VM69_COLES|nr:hypothetical protein [Colocasia esculenta]
MLQASGSALFLWCCFACSPGARHSRACPVLRGCYRCLGPPSLGSCSGSTPGYECARVGIPREQTLERRGKRPVLLVVPTSVFSQFRGPILGCQPVMAPACVASRPSDVEVFGVPGVDQTVLVSLPRSTLVPEPRREVRRGATAWPGCGIACVVCFCGGFVSPFTGVEAGARIASRACGLRVPLLATSGGGLVAVVVTTFPHDIFECSSLP